MNVIARLEYELAYYDSAVHRFNHYTTRTPPGRSSGQHPVSSHSCWMYVRAGRPAFAQPCVGIHKSTSLMSSSLLLQQCPACLVRLTWIVFVIGGRWPYSWCLVGCCCQDTQFLPGSGHIDTAIWMHYMDAKKTAGEEKKNFTHTFL